jgi:hypothetical protein
MKCPILTATSERLTGMTEYPPLDCLQAECAWWDEHLEGCSVKWLTRGVYDLIAAIHTYLHNAT